MRNISNNKIYNLGETKTNIFERRQLKQQFSLKDDFIVQQNNRSIELKHSNTKNTSIQEEEQFSAEK